MPTEDAISIRAFFESPEKWKGQEIAIRGFLYQKEGKTVLASEPNIPSCCLGKENKPYLVLQGDFPPPSNQIALVEGSIVKEASHWTMAPAKLIEKESRLNETLLLLCLLLFLAAILGKFWNALKIDIRNRF